MSSHAADITGVFSKYEAVCKYFLKSSCVKGDKCVFSHDMSVLKSCPENRVCHFYLRGTCAKGRNCFYLHEQPGLNSSPLQERTNSGYKKSKINNKENRENMLHPSLCKYFVAGYCCAGDDCEFVHYKPIQCVYHLRGFCRYGTSCLNAHTNYTTEQSCNVPNSSDKDVNTENYSAPSQIDNKQAIINDAPNNFAQEPACEGLAVGTIESAKNEVVKTKQKKFQIDKEQAIINDTPNNSAQKPGCEGSAAGPFESAKNEVVKTKKKQKKPRKNAKKGDL